MPRDKTTAELIAMLDAPTPWILDTRSHGSLRYALLVAASFRAEGAPLVSLRTADGAIAVGAGQLLELLRETGLSPAAG